MKALGFKKKIYSRFTFSVKLNEAASPTLPRLYANLKFYLAKSACYKVWRTMECLSRVCLPAILKVYIKRKVA